MRILLSLLLVFPALSLWANNVITEDSVRDNKEAAKFLIQSLNQQREKFCKSPSVSSQLTMTGSIRAASGKVCKNLLGAALAKSVCDKKPDIDKFSESQCKRKMDDVFTNMKVDSVLGGDKKAEFTWGMSPKAETAAETAIAFAIKMRGAEKVCASIDSYYNIGKSSCISGIKAKLLKKQ